MVISTLTKVATPTITLVTKSHDPVSKRLRPPLKEAIKGNRKGCYTDTLIDAEARSLSSSPDYSSVF